MKVNSKGIQIELEQDELDDLWNIIMFARDWQDSDVTKNKPKMTDSELKLADDLLDILNKLK